MRRPAGLILVATVVALTAAGCGSVYERRKTASLTMSPLAPAAATEGAVAPPQGIRIKTPMRIGLAFAPLPEGGGPSRDIPGELKQGLLEKVRSAFMGLTFVEAIEVVPATYLKEGNEFESLVAAAQAFNLDAVALITYDQEQFSDTSNWSLLYWTVVGLYAVPGERNETRTLLEASVVAVQPRVLLLHAVGADKSKGWSTPLRVAPGLREEAEESFERATERLIANLRTELDQAQAALKEERGLYGTPVAFVTEEGVVTAGPATGRQGGGGDLGWPGAVLLVLLGLGCALEKRRAGH